MTLRTRLLLPLCLMMAPLGASATESRKTALARSFLHVDDADMFLFPGMMGEWNRYVFVDAYTHVADADGGILLGESPVFAAVFDHPPLWNDIAAMDALHAEVSPTAPIRHVADLGLAFPSGPSAFGIMAGWGTGLQDAAVEDVNGDMRSTGFDANVFDVGLGWSSWAEGATRIDVGGGLTFNLYRQVVAGDVVLKQTRTPGVHASGRFLMPMSPSLDFGIEALVARRDYGFEMFPSGDATYSRIIGRVSVGPRIHPTERVTIGFFGRLHYESLGGEVDDDEGPTMTMVGFPGAGASIEYDADDHVTLRIGGDYQHAYQRLSYEPTGPANDTTAAITSDSTSWGFGVGYRKEGYKLDTAMTGIFDLGAGVFGGAQVVLAGAYMFQ